MFKSFLSKKIHRLGTNSPDDLVHAVSSWEKQNASPIMATRKLASAVKKSWILFKRFRFNVGGVNFECLKSSLALAKGNSLRLADPLFLAEHWDSSAEEFFFDKNPRVFEAVLDFVRSSELHVPWELCAPVIIAEFKFWGIPRDAIMACCHKEISKSMFFLQNLKRVEAYRQPAYLNNSGIDVVEEEAESGKKALRTAIYRVMFDSDYTNVAGKVYRWVSLMLVMVAIVMFTFPIQKSVINTVQSLCHNQTYADQQKTDCSNLLTAVWWAPTQGRVAISNMAKASCFLDLLSSVFFLLELLIGYIACPSIQKMLRTKRGVIDLSAVMVDFAVLSDGFISYKEPPLLSHSRTYLDTLRPFCIARVFRLVGRSPSLLIIFYSIWSSIKELLTVGFSVTTASVFVAVILQSLEAGKKPDSPSHFATVPEGIWYGIVTSVTVGYGDTVPVTPLGKIIGSICAMMGVVVIGIAAPTLVHNYLTYFQLFKFIEWKQKEFISMIKVNQSMVRLRNQKIELYTKSMDYSWDLKSPLSRGPRTTPQTPVLFTTPRPLSEPPSPAPLTSPWRISDPPALALRPNQP